MNLYGDVKATIKEIVVVNKMVTVGEVKHELECLFKYIDVDSYVVGCVCDLIKEGEIKMRKVKLVCKSFSPEIEHHKVILLAPHIDVVDVI